MPDLGICTSQAVELGRIEIALVLRRRAGLSGNVLVVAQSDTRNGGRYAVESGPVRDGS